jgi:SEC-C motif/Protein of unknown function (DUF2384)
MNTKLGRNDPCLCGSGKKYKHCCGSNAAGAAAQPDEQDSAVPRALAWLEQHHRKAWSHAFQQAFEDTIDEIFDDEYDDDEIEAALADLSDEVMGQVQINLTEWLLAEGEIQVKGEWMGVPELLLGQRGPLLSTGQRAWLEQLSHQPLRLYDVTEVVPGSTVTLCDALDTTLAPIVVSEATASRSMRVGMQIGARVMTEAGERVLSGAIYPFTAWAGRALLDDLRQLSLGAATLNPADPGGSGAGADVGADVGEGDADIEDQKTTIGLMIIEDWLAQHLLPEPLPQIVDSSSGEPMLFTTDHYEVLDWVELVNALAAQPEVEGSREAGWDRLVKGDDGLMRSRARIEAQAEGRRVSVQYKTAGLAERGRPWFNALAGAAARFLMTEVSDPKGMLAHRAFGASGLSEGVSLPAGTGRAALDEAMAKVMASYYANWADEPIPALDGRTPREAIATTAGLERVKGLLRSYEDGEARSSAEQGRSVFSYQFLWDALGLTR